MVFEIEVEETCVDDETGGGLAAPTELRLQGAAGGEVGVDERGGAVGDGLGEDERAVTFGNVEVELGSRGSEVVGGGEGEPGAAARAAGLSGFGGVLGAGGTESGCLGLGEGVGVPAGDEVFEAAGGAADIGPGEGEEGGGGLGPGRALLGWAGPGDERGFGVRPRRVSGDGGAEAG